MTLPTITVITPSFNQGRFIRQTIESVLSQQYPRLEYIVIDALSTDDTPAILADYADRLQLIAEKDNGQTDALNKGLRMATGEVVCWLNSDDYFLPGTLLAVGTFFALNPNQLWLTGDCLIVDEQSKIIQQPIRHYKRVLRQLSASLYLDMTNAICQPATFWRRAAHDELGYLDESLRYTMDYDWWLRLKQRQIPAVTDRLLTAFRIHKDSKGGSQFVGQFSEDFAVLTRYRTTRPVLFMHQWHNRLITTVYRILK